MLERLERRPAGRRHIHLRDIGGEVVDRRIRVRQPQLQDRRHGPGHHDHRGPGGRCEQRFGREPHRKHRRRQPGVLQLQDRRESLEQLRRQHRLRRRLRPRERGGGEHTYWFAATDKAGNIGYASRTATLDRTPPSASIAGSGFTSETRDNTPAFLVGATDAFSSVAQRTCSIDGVGTWQACDGSAWLPADALADGTYTARIDAVDAAGNHGTASTAFTIDATLPLITYGGFTGDRTTEATPGIEFWASDAHSVTTRCAYDPAGWDALADCAQGSGHAPAAPLALGQHQFWITATDSFGNVASAIYSFEVVEPTKPGDGQSGGNGQTGGQTGGAPAVTVKAASSKVRRGKFTLTVTVTATNLAACANAAVSVAPKVKKVKPLSARPAAKSSAGACVAVAKFKLAAKLKGKKAAITGAQGGASKRLTVKL